MKSVEIKSISSCNSITKNGSYFVEIKYKNHIKKLRGHIVMTTSNRCIITGLIIGIEQLKEPCNITLITRTEIGVKKYSKGCKSRNYDLFKELISTLETNNHKYLFLVDKARE